MRVRSLALVSFFVTACGGGVNSENAANTPTPSPTNTNGTPTPTPTGTPQPGQALRIIAIGDTGTGSADQYAVAAGIAAKCAVSGCDFGMLLGDNFYDTGVASVDDVQFQEKFEGPYNPLGFPFYVTLGNHDYGGDGAGWEFAKGLNQVAYAAENDNFILPAEYYSFEEGAATFLGLGSNLIFWDNSGAVDVQGDFFRNVLDGSQKPWQIAFGHHPYLSNGKHGNAGSYDNVPDFIPIAAGQNIKAFFDEYMCGRIDLYVCGHDHSRQILPGTAACPVTFLISGAGAKTTELPGSNPSLFQKDTIGFAYLVITEERITIEMLDRDGNVEFTHEILAN